MSIKVATYYDGKSGGKPLISKIRTYTVWYSPDWPGYRAYVVDTLSPKEAIAAARKLRFYHEMAEYQAACNGGDAPLCAHCGEYLPDGSNPNMPCAECIDDAMRNQP